MTDQTARLYYEAHVNFARNEQTAEVGEVLEGRFSNWKLATFEMHKDRTPTGFITGRHTSLATITEQV